MHQIITNDMNFTDTDFYKFLMDNRKARYTKYFVLSVRMYTGMFMPFKGRTDGFAHKATFDTFIRDISKPVQHYLGGLTRDWKTEKEISISQHFQGTNTPL